MTGGRRGQRKTEAARQAIVARRASAKTPPQREDVRATSTRFGFRARLRALRRTLISREWAATLDRLPARHFLALVLIAYAVARLFSTVAFAVVAPHQQPSPMSEGQPVDFWWFSANWDGQWYRRIAESGYPATLPRDPHGTIQQNPWAFYPAFPLLARVTTALTRLPFNVVAPLLALAFGFVAATLMARLLAARVGRPAALAIVWLFAIFPTSPVLQAAYGESLAVALVCAFLLAITARRWVAAAALAIVVGFVRPVALPLGLVALVAAWSRWRRRAETPVSPRERAGMVAAVVACGLAGIEWLLTAWIVTGSRTAYLDTMGAWAGAESRLISPWLELSRSSFGVTGPIVVMALFAGLLAIAAGPWSQRFGGPMRAWTGGYTAYVLLAQGPSLSTIRYLLLAFPYLGVLLGVAGRGAPTERPVVPRARLAVLTVAFLVLQWWWVATIWHFTPPSDTAP